MGRYHIHNVLDHVLDTVKSANDEFKLYETQLRCPVSQKECTASLKGAWDLDKYKFLHMLVRTWAMRPGRKWYVFAEADTYVFWPNLMLWLRTRADPDRDPYVGNVALADGFPFAHGGSGYVISGRLVQKLIESVPGLAAKYDVAAPDTCCGDLLLGQALAEIDVQVKHAFPMFNGERTNTLPFGDGHWCEPILTLHHMDAEQVGLVWQFEQTRTKTVRNPLPSAVTSWPRGSGTLLLTWRHDIPDTRADQRPLPPILRRRPRPDPRRLGQPLGRRLLHRARRQ